jgi:hypothetical protein
MSKKNFSESKKNSSGYMPCIEIASRRSACSLNEGCMPFVIKNKGEFKMSTTIKEKGKGNGKTQEQKPQETTDQILNNLSNTEKEKTDVIESLKYTDINTSMEMKLYNFNGMNLDFQTIQLGKSTGSFNRYLITAGYNNKIISLVVTQDRAGKGRDGIKFHHELTEELRSEFVAAKNPISLWKKRAESSYRSRLNLYSQASSMKLIQGQDLEDMFKSLRRDYYIMLRAGVTVDQPFEIKK